ncbi:MAG: tetratricopeptide repeat protein [Bryobacteraceae bacterium]
MLLAQDTSDELRNYFEQGERALSEHRYTDAEQAYDKLKQLSPGTAEVYGRLGLVYFQEAKFNEAVPALRKALKLKPGLPNTDVLLAMSLSELGRYEEALPGLEKGFRRSADQPLKRMSGLQLVRAYTGLQLDSKAVETALDLQRLFPDDPEVLYHTSRIYANYAYLTLRDLSQIAPDSVWRQQAAAEADESQGNLDLAITEYRRVLAMDPARRGIHYRIGRVLLTRSSSGQTDTQAQALKEFEQELDLDPTNANAAYEIGEIYRKLGQLDKAQEFFGKALQYYPDFEEAQLGLGGVLIALRKPEQALLHLKRAIALNPRDDVSYYRLSQAYKALGNTSEQQKSLAEFERLRGKSAQQEKTTFSQAREVTKQEIDATAPQ